MQFPTISIQKFDEQSMSSKSLDRLNQSWTLEKTTNDSGKTNYKLITSDLKSSSRPKKNRKSVQNHKSIAAYGVPSADAYLNNKAQTLNSSIIKTIKKASKKKENEPTNDAVAIEDEPEQFYDVTIERFAESKGKINKNMIITNNTILEYKDENDLLKKSFIYGHLIKSYSIIKNIYILLSYFGREKLNLTISIWSLNFLPQMELQNLVSIPFKNLAPNVGKFIKNELNSRIVQKGQLFLTVHSESLREGDLMIKYSVLLEQKTDAQQQDEVFFEFPDFFNTFQSRERFAQEGAIVADIPQISNNASVFGDFIVKTQDDIPIFGKKKKKQDDVSVSSTYAKQSKMAALSSYPEIQDDVSEKDNTDINNILNILRNQ